LADTVPPLVVGLLVSIYVQTVTGWWLNSGRGAAATSGALFALAVFSSSFKAGSPRVRLWALWTGAQVGLVGYLFRQGPGTIFPIVIVSGAVLSAVAVAAGGGVGWLVSRLTTRRRN
jgi:hypothetical protein